MSVEHSEQIQEEDESNSLSKPSTVESVQNAVEKNTRDEATSEPRARDKCGCDALSDCSEQNTESVDNRDENVGNVEMTEPEDASVRHGVKRT